MSKRRCENWLETYLEFTKKTESPESFHLWAGLSMMAASTRRSIVLYRGFIKVFPNIYVVLVAASGRLRKSTAQDIALDVFKTAFPEDDVIEESMSAERMITDLHQQHREVGVSSMFIVSDEFSTLIGRSKSDQMLISNLTKFYDCKDKVGARTQSRGKIICRDVYANLFATTTPHWLRLALPSDVIGGGFTSRIVFIYEEVTDRCFPIPVRPSNYEELKFKLVEDLQCIRNVEGIVKFSLEADDWYDKWYRTYTEPDVCDPLLIGYYGRRHTHLCKISALLSLARNDDLIVTLKDITMADALLKDTEMWLPKIMHMLQTNVIGEANSLVLNVIAKLQPVTTGELLRRLSYRLGTTDLNAVLWTLEQSELIKVQQKGGKYWYVLDKAEGMDKSVDTEVTKEDEKVK